MNFIKMEYKLLDKITDKAFKLLDKGRGREFNLLLSEDYYEKFKKEIDNKYTSYASYPESDKVRKDNITYMAVNGMTFHIIKTENIKTYKIIAVDGRLPTEQDTDADNRDFFRGNPYGD